MTPEEVAQLVRSLCALPREPEWLPYANGWGSAGKTTRRHRGSSGTPPMQGWSSRTVGSLDRRSTQVTFPSGVRFMLQDVQGSARQVPAVT